MYKTVAIVLGLVLGLGIIVLGPDGVAPLVRPFQDWLEARERFEENEAAWNELLHRADAGERDALLTVGLTIATGGDASASPSRPVVERDSVRGWEMVKRASTMGSPHADVALWSWGIVPFEMVWARMEMRNSPDDVGTLIYIMFSEASRRCHLPLMEEAALRLRETFGNIDGAEDMVSRRFWSELSRWVGRCGDTLAQGERDAIKARLDEGREILWTAAVSGDVSAFTQLHTMAIQSCDEAAQTALRALPPIMDVTEANRKQLSRSVENVYRGHSCKSEHDEWVMQ